MSLREKNKARTRMAILDATKTLANKGQWDSVTTRQIADAAGVSYQTLYNYYPAKAAVLREMLLDAYIGPGPAINEVVKQYSGDLLATLDSINRVRFQSFSHDDLKWLLPLGTSFARPDRSAETTSLIETIDQAGDGYYYSALSTAKGTGHLQDDVDIQLMAHTLYGIANTTLDRYILNSANAKTQLLTLRQQMEQLVRPYLTI
jgi:AcrR family transcriptional regulator